MADFVVYYVNNSGFRFYICGNGYGGIPCYIWNVWNVGVFIYLVFNGCFAWG